MADSDPSAVERESARPCFDRVGKLARESWCDRLGHCWHVSAGQHTIDRHRDDSCCYCGEHRCVRVEGPGGFRANVDGTQYGGHGKFREGEMVSEDADLAALRRRCEEARLIARGLHDAMYRGEIYPRIFAWHDGWKLLYHTSESASALNVLVIPLADDGTGLPLLTDEARAVLAHSALPPSEPR